MYWRKASLTSGTCREEDGSDVRPSIRGLVELVGVGRTAGSLGREFEPFEQTSGNGSGGPAGARVPGATG